MRRTSTVVGALLCSLLSAAPHAHAQGVPPVVSPPPSTGSVSALSADELVNRASVAQQAAGSVRISSVSRNRSSGSSTETIRSHGVISFTQQRYAFSSIDRTVIVNAHSTRTMVKHRREILVDPILAQRTSQGAWHCQNIQAMEASAGDLLAVLKGGGGLSVQYGPVTNAAIGAIAVWDVPLVIAPGGTGTGSGLTLSEHLFISQADFTVVRDVSTTTLDLSLRQHGKLVQIKNTQKTTTEYSDYGVPVSIALPAACAATSGASSTTNYGGLSLFRLVSGPPTF